MKLTQFTVQRKLAATAIILALLVLGFYGYSKLQVDYLPQITYPVIKLQIKWQGATPEEVEQEIAEPVERLISTVDKLDYISSTSREGLYALDVNFIYGADVDVAFQDVLAALTRVKQKLPEDSEEPYVFKADPSQLPVLQIAVNSDTWDSVKLRTWTENWLQDRLLDATGVAGSEIVGGLEREIIIRIDPKALEKYQISLDTVINRISNSNLELSSGRINAGSKEIIARSLGRFNNLEEIRQLTIKSAGNRQVRLKDLASVIDSHKEERIITRFNQKNSVRISIMKEAEANTVETAEAVKQLMDSLRPSLPAGIAVEEFDNQAVYVKNALRGVSNAAITAAVLLIFIIYLFLGSFRQVFMMILSLPLTLILNFGLMQIAGFSLNIFSLGGLVVAIGLVLDNTIIVLENTTRWQKMHPSESTEKNVVSAVDEVQPSLIAATLSFLALFVPFLIVPGLTSLLFKELILVIAGIIIISLLVAISVTPMLFSIFFGNSRKKQYKNRSVWFEKIFTKLTESYGNILAKFIKWRFIILLFFLFLLGLAVMLFKGIGSEFLPMVDDGRIMIKVKMPTGAALSETNDILKKIEQQIGDDKNIQNMFTLAGGQSKGLTTYEIANEGEINIQLIPRSEREFSTAEYVAQLRKKIMKLQPPGGKIMARQMPPRGIKGLRASDINLQIRGQNIDVLADLAYQIMQKINQLPQFRNATISMNLTKPEYQIKLDRIKIDALGLTTGQIASTLRAYVSGRVVTQYQENDEYYDIRVKVDEEKITSRTDLENLPLMTTSGNYLKVRDVANIEPGSGPVEISRESQIKQVVVEADITGRDIAGSVELLRRELEKIDLPVGYQIEFGGNTQMMDDMKNTVLVVFAFALFFSFIVLTVQFNDIKLPLLVLGSVPLSLTGSVFLLWLTNTPMGATVIIGLLVVIGATVNDGVLLINFADEISKKNKLNPVSSIIESAKIRMRPRIMTTLTTMMGFLPLAINLDEGTDMLKPMAVAAIGGLIIEIFVTLFLMPILYSFKKIQK